MGSHLRNLPLQALGHIRQEVGIAAAGLAEKFLRFWSGFGASRTAGWQMGEG